MSSYRCSEHDTHQNGCSTCEVAKDYYDKDARIEQLTKEREGLIGLCKAAGCPQCNGDGAYYDNHGRVCQCQWCDEFSKHKGDSQ